MSVKSIQKTWAALEKELCVVDKDVPEYIKRKTALLLNTCRMLVDELSIDLDFGGEDKPAKSTKKRSIKKQAGAKKKRVDDEAEQAEIKSKRKVTLVDPKKKEKKSTKTKRAK